MERQKLIAVIAVAIAVVVVGAEWYWSQKSARNAEAESVSFQRQASGRPGPEQMRSKMMDQLAKQLGLTDAQKKQMASIQGKRDEEDARGAARDGGADEVRSHC